MGFFDQAATGAASMSGLGPWGALAGGLLGGLFGRRHNTALDQLTQFQMGIANQLRDYGNGVPMSDPQEQSALAQDRGLLGEEQRGQNDQMGAAFGRANIGNTGDFLRNMSSQQTGQRMALDSQHVLASLQRRRQSLMEASQVAGGAYGPAATGFAQQSNNLAGMFGQLAQQIAYQRHSQVQAQSQGPWSELGGQIRRAPDSQFNTDPAIGGGYYPQQTAIANAPYPEFNNYSPGP